MQWWYKLLFEDESKYVYGYSRESKECDGRIVYSKKDGIAIMEKPSKKDEAYETSAEASLEHFYYVVEEGFPKERHVCCG